MSRVENVRIKKRVWRVGKFSNGSYAASELREKKLLMMMKREAVVRRCPPRRLHCGATAVPDGRERLIRPHSTPKSTAFSTDKMPPR